MTDMTTAFENIIVPTIEHVEAFEAGRELRPGVEISRLCGNSAGLISQPEVEAMTTPSLDMTPRTSILRSRTQIYDARVLGWYRDRVEELPQKQRHHISSLYEATQNFNEVQVSYGLRGWAGEIGYGRVYANTAGSLETIPRKLRANLCARHYWDVDIENAQPVILAELGSRYGLNLRKLKDYCRNREEIFKMLEPEFGSRTEVKTAFIACFYGASIPALAEYQRDMERLYEKMAEDPAYAAFLEEVKKDVKKHNDDVPRKLAAGQKAKTKKVPGVFLATLAQSWERKILEELDEFYTARERSVDCLAYDGVMIRKEDGEATLDADLLRDAEVWVEEKTDFRIRLALKPMTCSIPERELESIKVKNPVEERWELIGENTPSSLCRLYSIVKAGNVLYSKALKSFYIFDTRSGLWRKHCDSDINVDFVDTIKAITREMAAALPKAGDNKAIADDNEAKEKMLKEVQRTVNGRTERLVGNFLPSFVCPEDFEPAVRFNQTEHLFPLKNGVFNFRTKKLQTYKKEDYFTFKVPINYNAEASTEDIRTAMTQWFRGNERVIAFVKYWLGYCLTPVVSRQEFLVVWGESAGNGKSTLFDDLFKTLLTGVEGAEFQTYFHKLNIKDLTVDSGSNNDTVYNCAGKRMCLGSEPKTRSKIDSELIKSMTGETSKTVSAKYKNEMTFNLLCKMVVLCNKMFDVDMDDEGILRRILVLEMNTKFLDAAEYADAKEADKASGKVQLKDRKLVEKLKGNMEGVLLYFLQGACEYFEDPDREVPMEFRQSKLKAKAGMDDITQWITGYLVPDAGSRVTMRELKGHWRGESRQFMLHPINKHGFNTVFYKKVKQAGYEPKFSEDRPEEGYIQGVRLWNEETDAPHTE
jgi:P4 family phage/plasmid primase-like protien